MENNTEFNKKLKYVRILIIVCTLALLYKYLLVTVYQQEGFENLSQYQTTVEVKQSLPRGEIYDSQGTLMAGNKLTSDLMYIEPNIMDEEQKYETASKIADIADVDSSNLTDNDLKDLWLSGSTGDTSNFLIAADKMNSKESATLSNLDDGDPKIDEMYRAKVTKEDTDALIKKYGEETLMIRVMMNQATTKQPATIKSDISLDEKYAIEQATGTLGGFYVADDWERTYPQKETLSSFIGGIGQIPEEDRNLYESQGYDMNEKVGTSYLEKQLEPVLHSTPQTYECFFDQDGNLQNMKVKDDGVQGNDVLLTMDLKFQKKVDSIVKEQLQQNTYKYNTASYAMVSDPNNGNILAISSQNEKDGKYYENSIGNFTSSYPVGSVVKPAVLLMGYDLGVWDYNQYVYDAPMYIKGTPTKASYHDYGSVNEVKALAVSSNVYFYQLLLKIAGVKYEPYKPLDVKAKYFNVVRKEFEQFGLGVSTGIDMENETMGVRGSEKSPGKYMDLANGQYDTYTNLQVNQYLSTIANGGTRYKVNYIKSINSAGAIGKPGNVVYEQKPVILNHISMPESDVDHMKLGMQACYEQPYGTGHTGGFMGLPVSAACKTGTSEDFVYDADAEQVYSVNNASFLGYAPQKNPEIAVSLLLPSYVYGGDFTQSNGAPYAKEIVDYYFEEMKK